AWCDGSPDVRPAALEALEAMAFGGHQWWELQVLLTNTEKVLPHRLREFLPALVAGDLPPDPLDITHTGGRGAMAGERDHLTSAGYQGRHPSYGIDAPGVVLGLTAGGGASWMLAAVAAGGNIPALAAVAAISGVFWFAGVGYMVFSSVSGKKRLWRQ